MGESIDLVRYIDKEFDGPALMPNDPEKKKFGEELISYSDHFVGTNFASCRSKGEAEAEVGEVYNKLEDALSKFEDGPFFLGQFSMVDIVYAPFLERFKIFYNGMRNYDITKGRPLLALWFQEVEKIEAFTHTKCDPQEHLASMKVKFGIN